MTSDSSRDDHHETFSNDVKEHQMTVELDSGVHRCLLFSRPDSNIGRFRLTTWSGHLAVTGDMGDYIFCRLTDMFAFFRGRRIDAGYYAEKCVAGDIEEFRPDLWSSLVSNLLEMEAINESLVSEMSCDEPSSPDEAYDMMCAAGVGDASEYLQHLYDYTEHFIWCLNAIKWGIEQYDAHHESKGE